MSMYDRKANQWVPCPDWLIIAPVKRNQRGDLELTVRNTNTKIGGYLATSTYRLRPELGPSYIASESRYFCTSNIIAHAICLLINEDTRHFYAHEIACAELVGNLDQRDYWERARFDFERGY